MHNYICVRTRGRAKWLLPHYRVCDGNRQVASERTRKSRSSMWLLDEHSAALVFSDAATAFSLGSDSRTGMPRKIMLEEDAVSGRHTKVQKGQLFHNGRNGHDTKATTASRTARSRRCRRKRASDDAPGTLAALLPPPRRVSSWPPWPASACQRRWAPYPQGPPRRPVRGAWDTAVRRAAAVFARAGAHVSMVGPYSGTMVMELGQTG